jgi:hypothetical protein
VGFDKENNRADEIGGIKYVAVFDGFIINVELFPQFALWAKNTDADFIG